MTEAPPPEAAQDAAGAAVPPPRPAVHAHASDQAQQAVLVHGVQHNYWYATPGGATRRPDGTHGPVDTLLPPPHLVGRADELARLHRLRETAREQALSVAVSVVHGMGGIGKTALARAFAAQVADDYPDARIEVDLHGFASGIPPREPGEVLGELLGLTGFSPSEVPDSLDGRSQVWRAWLSERKVLLILDNARDAAQLLPLFPGRGATGEHHCLVVVTSRNWLAELDATAVFGVEVLPLADAVALLVRTGLRSPEEMHESAAELRALARSCGLLPLALRSVGSLLRHLEPRELTEVMTVAERPFQHLVKTDQAVAAAFTASYGALSADLQDILRVCAWHPGPDFDAASIAALADRPRPVVTVSLAELVQANMLAALPFRRCTFHDLYRSYARQRAEEEDAQDTIRDARERLYADLQNRLDSATGLIYPDNRHAVAPQDRRTAFTDRAQAHDWLFAAMDELTAGALAALRENSPGARRLADTMAYWSYAGGRGDQSTSLHRALHAAARAVGDRAAQVDALQGIGEAAHSRGESEHADRAFRDAYELAREIDDLKRQADALKGLADVVRLRGEHGDAGDYYRQADSIYRQLDLPRDQVHTLEGLGYVAYALEQLQAARDAYHEAYELACRIGYRSGQADLLCGLAAVAERHGDHAAAGDAYTRAHDVYAEIGNRHGLAYALKGLGDVARRSGAYDAAREAYRKADDLYKVMGFPHCQADVYTGVGDVALACGDTDEADRYFRQACDISARIGYRSGEADAQRGLGDVRLARGDRQGAAQAYRNARDLYHRLGSTDGLAAAERGLARAGS